MGLGICTARKHRRKSVLCPCVRTDWGTYRLSLWQMYRTSCIMYVRSFSYAQKPDVLSISGSLHRKHVGTRWRKPNNNKQVFSVTNSSHFGTNNKRTFWGSRQQEASNLCFSRAFSLPFLCFWSMREFLSFSKACESPGEQFWQGDIKHSLRAKQTAVAYGWDMQRRTTSEPHSRGDEGLLGM